MQVWAASPPDAQTSRSTASLPPPRSRTDAMPGAAKTSRCSTLWVEEVASVASTVPSAASASPLTGRANSISETSTWPAGCTSPITTPASGIRISAEPSRPGTAGLTVWSTWSTSTRSAPGARVRTSKVGRATTWTCASGFRSFRSSQAPVLAGDPCPGASQMSSVTSGSVTRWLNPPSQGSGRSWSPVPAIARRAPGNR